MYSKRLHAWWSAQSGVIARWWFGLSDLKSWLRAWCCVCEVLLLDFFYSGIQLNILLSPYLYFISFSYLDLYVQVEDTPVG